MIRLDRLHPGDRFRLDELTGEVLHVNECRVLVRIERGRPQTRTVTFADGRVATFTASREVVNWAPGAEVEVER